MVTFHDFSVMGLLPPFSYFFLAILEAFGLHMLHLHPNVVMIMASFAYSCEAFVGVMPFVALFRHYFVPHLGKSKWIVGGVTFCLRRSAAHQYPELKLKSRWGEWRHNWYLVSEESLSPHLLLPTSPAEYRNCWRLRPAGNRPTAAQTPADVGDPPKDRVLVVTEDVGGEHVLLDPGGAASSPAGS